mmetsp:Transcript_103457/g.194622  ORF Transcript_103457/g.194622 Transcript_103457/m.194622 type:complete len:157 (+) Transcript_103457:883-1353(+)
MSCRIISSKQPRIPKTTHAIEPYASKAPKVPAKKYRPMTSGIRQKLQQQLASGWHQNQLQQILVEHVLEHAQSGRLQMALKSMQPQQQQATRMQLIQPITKVYNFTPTTNALSMQQNTVNSSICNISLLHTQSRRMMSSQTSGGVSTRTPGSAPVA